MIKKIVKKITPFFASNSFKTLNIIELSAANLIHNFNLIKSQNPEAQIIPVLKSNAYGHGTTQIGRLLNLVKCRMIAVDGYFEANQLSKESNHKILVMGYIDSRNYRLLNYRKCSFVIQSVPDLISLGRLNKHANIHIAFV